MINKDASLDRLRGSMSFKPASVRPICLPLEPDSQSPGKRALVTGWGSTEDGSAISQTLRKVQLPVLPNEVCVRAYRDQPFVRIWQRQLCAGGVRARDSCNGDSGGPLQSVAVYGGRPRFVQHGIVSFGRRNCALQDSPGVYTNVAYYLDWILDTMEE